MEFTFKLVLALALMLMLMPTRFTRIPKDYCTFLVK
jgi:hypothetical protein